MGLFALIIIYPFYNALLISLSTERVYLDTPFLIFPKEINFDSYLTVFRDQRLLLGYRNTLILLVAGTAYSLFFTTITGYAMSRDGWFGKNFIMNMILVTMFIGGGIIPYFYLIKGLGLYNNFLVMIIPGAVETFNMLLIRNYFAGLPKELEEAAKIDNANDMQIFYKVFLPLSLPMLATIGLFFAVGNWNQWYTALLYIENPNYKTLQLVLRELIVTGDASFANPLNRPQFTEGLKMASIFFTIVPIMALYPFLQKYFVKGLVVGAIKG
jgi:putative aldouronate transport system permease protein